MVMQIDHAALRVPDLAAATTWYADMFDLQVTASTDDRGMTFAFLMPRDGHHFRLELVTGPGASEVPSGADLGESFRHQGWHHVAFRVESVDATMADLERRGAKVAAKPFDIPDFARRAAFISDPWGNLLELTQLLERHEDRALGGAGA